MRELSLHILDIVQNSIAAGAQVIEVIIEEDTAKNIFNITVIDDGKGMDKEILEQVIDPFTTSRKTRDVGLGIPLLKAAAERCDGYFKIESTPGEGTILKANFVHGHIDRAPLGDMVETLIGVIMVNPQLEFIYKHSFNEHIMFFDTKEIKKELEGVRINEITVINWLRGYLVELFQELYGGEG